VILVVLYAVTVDRRKAYRVWDVFRVLFESYFRVRSSYKKKLKTHFLNLGFYLALRQSHVTVNNLPKVVGRQRDCQGPDLQNI